MAVGLLAWTWDFFAHQVPSSAWHVVGYPVAIGRLAEHAWIEALVLFTLAPRAFSHGPWLSDVRARALSLTATTGTALTLGSLAISARTGVLGMQLEHTSAFSSALLAVRLLGDALSLAALAVIVRGALREPSAPPSAAPPS